MSITKVQSVNAAYFMSMLQNGDGSAMMKHMDAAVSNELSDAARNYSETSKYQIARLEQLPGLQAKLGNLALFKSPDGTTVLTKVDSDTGLAMTLPVHDALKAELASLGFSLTTHVRAQLSSVTTDKDGKQVGSTKQHLGSVAEMAAAEKGVKTPYATTDASGYTSVATDTNGNKITYDVVLSTTAAGSMEVATASLADIKSLMAAVEDEEELLYAAIDVENARIESFAHRIIDRMNASQSMFAEVRKDETTFREMRLDAQSQGIDHSLDKTILVRRHLQNHDAVRIEARHDGTADPAVAADGQPHKPARESGV